MVNLILIIIKRITKKHYRKSRCIIFSLLCLILIYPVVFFLGIVPFGYPSKLEKDNYHVIWSSERWAYDLVMEPYGVGSDSLEDYGIWNKEVFSPVSGKVIGAYDSEEDVPPDTEEFLSAEGNYVFIQIEETKTYFGACRKQWNYIGTVSSYTSPTS